MYLTHRIPVSVVKTKKNVKEEVYIKKPKTEKKHDTTPVVNVLADLYKKIVHVSTLPTMRGRKKFKRTSVEN